MKTFKRICIHDHTVKDSDESFTVNRGTEYITSVEEGGYVTVFSTYWAKVPVSMFAGEVPGPGDPHNT